MATGILSLDALDDGHEALSKALLGVAIALYVAVAACALCRPKAVRSEMADPIGGLGAFAAVAATEVLAVRLGRASIELPALAVGGAGWAVMVAVLLVACRRAAPTGHRAERLRGASLLAAVAPQSLAFVATDIGRGLAGLALALWLVGLASYLLLAPGVVVACRSQRRARRELAGDQWILMGALAIATVAASQLGLAWPESTISHTPLVLWLLSTAWLPVLLAVEAVPRGLRTALRYRPQRFSTVFPLGMYALACHAVGRSEDWSALGTVAATTFGAGLLVWALTIVGALRRTANHLRSGRPGEASPTTSAGDERGQSERRSRA